MPDETPIQVFERALRAAAGSPAPGTPKPEEVEAVWAFTGLEVALVRGVVARNSAGRIWGERRAGRGTPLLLVAPSEHADRVLAVGPLADTGNPNRPSALRDVHPETLANVVASLRNESAIRAGRGLDDSLGRLSAEAVPGVVVRGLLTDHYVKVRLKRHNEVMRGRLAAAAAPATGRSDWRDALTALGYTIADHRGEAYIARAGQRPVALIHAKRTAEDFARIDERGRLPEGALVADCQAEGLRWGLMVSGSRIRLFEARTDRGAATERWIDLDLAVLPEDQRHLVGLLTTDALDEGGAWTEMIEEVRRFGVGLKERLDDQIRRQALPEIARGLGEWVERRQKRSLDDPEVRREIQQATNTLLFRLLFVLYAESAGHLPIGRSPAYTDNALYTLGRRARETRAKAGGHALWDRLQVLTRAIREGSTSMDLPQYNGSLFAADDLPGARLLEEAEVADRHLAPALEALVFDFEGDDDAGLDYTGLDIAHLGGIYEGLLALRLSRADQTYAWDKSKDRFVPSEDPGDTGVEAGQLFFQTEAGGRKGGGVYYTRQEFVRHLVNHSVLPALDEHLEQVRRLANNDAEAATRLLFRFRVLDPAMGSGHFLVDALDVIAERVQKFLAETPLPPLKTRLDALRSEAHASQSEADDAQLLKRLLLKHCIYGVDLQEMAVELARVALWLSSFVPGLALSYLDQNLKRGDSLVGVASTEVVLESSGKGSARAFWGLPGGPLDLAIAEAGKLAAEIADLADRTKAEVERSRELRAQLDARLAGVRRLFNLWTAEPFGVKGARTALLQGDQLIDGEPPADLRGLINEAEAEAKQRHFFHWPLEFPEVFYRGSERTPGFDAVIGNPPWDETNVEELGFYALHDPGLRGLSTEAERADRVRKLVERRPELQQDFELQREVTQTARKFFRPENGYPSQGAGNLDLYELFAERYGALARSGGRLGVVLPRTSFLGYGSRGFRRWLFRECTPTRLDTILNNRSWAFPIHPQWTLVLLTAETGRRQKGGILTLTGPSASEQEFQANLDGNAVTLALDDLAAWTPAPLADASQEPSWELPLLPTQRHARLLGRLRHGPRFDRWCADHSGAFILQGDMNETTQKALFQQKSGVAVWRGRSFDQYDPHGSEPTGFGNWEKILGFVQGKRMAKNSNFAGKFPPEVLADPSTHPIHNARVAFRDVTNRTNSRTMLSCLVPPRTPLTNKAPYLVFPSGDPTENAYVLGVFNSLPFDWQARRFVETNVNFFILNLLCFPPEDAANIEIAKRAAQLSCPDERFAEFAKAMKVKVSPLSDEEFDGLRAEIDALVAIAYGLDAADLETVFEDFTLNAVPETYRALVREKYAEFSSQGAS